MKDHIHKTDTFTESDTRNHSPYCEATGPIVQQGFVAARIRSIQQKYGTAPQGMSHSPMTPCPVPRWLRSTNPLSRPKPLLAPGLPASSRTCNNNEESSITLSYSNKNSSSPVNATVPRGTTAVAARNHVPDEVGENETMISGPQAISSSLTHSFEDTGPSCQGKSHCYDIVGTLPNPRQRCSVADKLDSLVSSAGWVGHDAYEEADENQADPKSCTQPGFRQTEIVYKSPSQIESSMEVILPSRRCIDRHENTHCGNSHQQIADHTRTPQHIGQHKPGHGIKAGHKTGNSQDVSGRKDHDNRTQSYEKEHRDASLHDLMRSEGCQDVWTKPQKLSLSTETKNHLPEKDDAAGRDKRPKPQHIITMKSHTENGSAKKTGLLVRSRKGGSMSPASSIYSSHISSASTPQRSKRSTSRSTSWFARLTGYRVVLVDKTPAIRSWSRCISEPNIKSRRNLQQDRDQPQRYLAIAEKETESDSKYSEHDEQESQSGEPKPRVLQNGDVPEVVQRSTREKEGNKMPEAMTNINEAPSDISAPKNDIVLPVDLFAHCSKSLSAHHPLTSQQLHSSRGRESQNSIDLPALCQASTAAMVASTPSSIQDTSEEETYVSEINTMKLPQKQSPRAVSRFGVQNSPQSHRTDEQPEQTLPFVNWRTLGTWKGAKMVQIIVSSDEADSFVVEAKLLGKSVKEKEASQAYKMQV